MKYLSTLMTDARGKAGNIVASKNRGGNYFRGHTIPKNPKSADQLARRNTLSTLAKDWRTLSDDQRAGWNTLSGTITRTDSLGNHVKQSGEQLFVGCNANLAIANLGGAFTAPAASDAPTAINYAPLVTNSANTGGTGEAFTVGSSAPAAGDAVFIFATAPYSAGKSFVGKSEYRLINTQLHADATPVNILAAYNAKFGHLATGSKVSVKLVPISANGFAGAPFVQTVTITAAA